MNLFLGVLILLGGTLTHATVSCDSDPIYCHISRISPNISSKVAYKLSNIIYKESLRYKIPPKVLTAILMQESNFKTSAIRKVCGLKQGERVCISTDFGIAQIHYKTVKSYKFDINRLLTEDAYSIAAGAKVLAWFSRAYSKNESFWWTRYNCGTRKSIKRPSCEAYKLAVSRYF